MPYGAPEDFSNPASLDGTTSLLTNLGIDWDDRGSAASGSGICYGNGQFVAVTFGAAFTSPDGINWTFHALPAASWADVCYGNGLYVAVGDGALGVVTSPDGITWTSRVPATVKVWDGVTYGKGLFVAVALTGAAGTAAMTSPNGVDWTSQIMPSTTWRAITFANNLFVAMGSTIATSPDAVTWTARVSALAFAGFNITYGNGLYVAVNNSNVAQQVQTSPNGITWTARTAPGGTIPNWAAVTYGSGLFSIADRTLGFIATSPDGITWTQRATFSGSAWENAAYGNGVFTVVGTAGPPFVVTSGKNFTDIPTYANRFQGGMAIFGDIVFDGTNTGVVGAVTINKTSGRVNIAAGGAAVVVTNNLVTAASHIFVVISSADLTAQLLSVVPAAGAFTINTVPVTAQTSFDFLVFNAM